MFVSNYYPGLRPTHQYSTKLLPVLVAGTIFLAAGCSSSDDDQPANDDAPVSELNNLGPVIETRHEGEDDGLLGGFGLSGLRSPPVFYADAANPTAAELRRATLHTNYTGLLDLREEGGLGTLYGPMDDTRFAGREFRAFVGDGINRATVMVQLPDSFDAADACLVVAPSSGSRNAYGAAGTSGEWALAKGCAVAYTDANKGTGAVDLSTNLGFDISLQAIDLASSDEEPSFQVPTTSTVATPGTDYQGVALPTDEDLMTYVQDNPDRFAFKHAHSQKNVEKDWGSHTLQSVSFALSVISDATNQTLTPENTLIIGASVSNGGGAVLRAAEASDGAIFDGVVVGEPNITPVEAPEPFTIAMAGQPDFNAHSKPLYDYAVTAELYAACASKAPVNAGAVFAELRGDTTPRCNALVEAGLLEDGSLPELGDQSNQRLIDSGYLPESTRIVVGYAGVDLFQTLLATYGNAYTRSSVVDALCNVSMAHVVTGTIAPANLPAIATLAADSSGIPRTAGVFLIKDDSPVGPALQFAAPSASGELDYNLEGAICWQDIRDNSANPLHTRLRQGISEILGDGNLHGVPSIIVHGRADALIPVNHSSRPYYALNNQIEGEASLLRYYEIRNSQHLDSLLGAYADGDMNFVPIDYYFKQSLDLMYSHLTDGTELPASQVVAATAPVAGNVTIENLVPIDPAANLPILSEGNRLLVPE
ncbi:MAG: 3-hydroxybutyrate oligomer hydrolase family protein [Granulosicoccus sp.]